MLILPEEILRISLDCMWEMVQTVYCFSVLLCAFSFFYNVPCVRFTH